MSNCDNFSLTSKLISIETLIGLPFADYVKDPKPLFSMRNQDLISNFSNHQICKVIKLWLRICFMYIY